MQLGHAFLSTVSPTAPALTDARESSGARQYNSLLPGQHLPRVGALHGDAIQRGRRRELVEPRTGSTSLKVFGNVPMKRWCLPSLTVDGEGAQPLRKHRSQLYEQNQSADNESDWNQCRETESEGRTTDVNQRPFFGLL